MARQVALAGLLIHLGFGVLQAEPPSVSYIFPAGGKVGTKVPVRIGGHFLHDKASFEIRGSGIEGPSEIHRTETTWFEGPLIKQPASQQAEDYPQDYAAVFSIAADACPGVGYWRVWNAQGITPSMKFLVGTLPEVIEEEIDGEPIPSPINLPVTVNGRIFPRGDIDIWTFEVAAGESVTCRLAAAEFGSPLKARLEVRGPDGRRIAETTGDAQGRVQLRFTTAVAGRHEVHVQDVAAGGLQHYVYRLTMTSGPWIDAVYPLGGRRGSELRVQASGQGLGGETIAVRLPNEVGLASVVPPLLADGVHAAPLPLLLDVDDLAEHLEAEPNQDAATAASLAVPGIASGRIDQPGDRDLWKVSLIGGETVQLSLRAGQLGSPLAGVVAVRDSAGKELATAAWLDQQQDVELAFTPLASGEYLVEVRDQFESRGGEAFAYRLRFAPPPADFDLILPVDGVAVEVGGTAKLEVKVHRRGELQSPLLLHVDGLPDGVTCDDAQVPEKEDKGTLVFKAGANIAVMTAVVRVVGKGELAGTPLQRVAHAGSLPGESLRTDLRLVTTLKTPFKFAAQYDFRYTPRGTVLKKRFTIDRGGFAGPLVAQLADRQGRHLQGVTGPVISIPADAAEFEYELFLPPWMELGRTSRTNLMLSGEVQDASGATHHVCFTTREQNEQMIALVSPSVLRIVPEKMSVLIPPAAEVVVPVQIKRDRTVVSPLRLELVLPRHVRDVAAESVVVPPDVDVVEFRLRTGPAPGPLNVPLVIRATGERDGKLVVAEAALEGVADR